MNFAELVADVLTITKRPDQQARAESEVRIAILKAHSQNFFYKDLVEKSVRFLEPGHIQNFKPSEVFPNFRKMKYIRYWNGPDGGIPMTEGDLGRAGPFLEAIDIENSFNAYGYTKTDVFYMAGELQQLRTSSPIEYCLAGAYVLPPVAGITGTVIPSWICVEQPGAVIYEAARKIFMQSGKNQDAQNMQLLLREEYAMLMINSVNQPGE